jgi:hypothetical protein
MVQPAGLSSSSAAALPRQYAFATEHAAALLVPAMSRIADGRSCWLWLCLQGPEKEACLAELTARIAGEVMSQPAAQHPGAANPRRDPVCNLTSVGPNWQFTVVLNELQEMDNDHLLQGIQLL